MINYIPATPQWVGPLGLLLPSYGYPSIAGAGTYFLETSDSQHYVLDIKSRLTQTFEGPYQNLFYTGLWGFYNRGIINGNWIINNSTLTKTKGGKGHLTIEWESRYSVPYDEWSVTPEDLQPRIERHPLFNSLTASDFATIQKAILASSDGAQTTAINNFGGTSNPDLVNTLYQKMAGGQETYYLAGARYNWTRYFIPGGMPAPSPGGFIESPGGPSGYVLPSGLQWLREADDFGLALYSPLGGIVKLTRHWLGAPYGHWPIDLYGGAWTTP